MGSVGPGPGWPPPVPAISPAYARTRVCSGSCATGRTHARRRVAPSAPWDGEEGKAALAAESWLGRRVPDLGRRERARSGERRPPRHWRQRRGTWRRTASARTSAFVEAGRGESRRRPISCRHPHAGVVGRSLARRQTASPLTPARRTPNDQARADSPSLCSVRCLVRRHTARRRSSRRRHFLVASLSRRSSQVCRRPFAAAGISSRALALCWRPSSRLPNPK